MFTSYSFNFNAKLDILRHFPKKILFSPLLHYRSTLDDQFQVRALRYLTLYAELRIDVVPPSVLDIQPSVRIQLLRLRYEAFGAQAVDTHPHVVLRDALVLATHARYNRAHIEIVPLRRHILPPTQRRRQYAVDEHLYLAAHVVLARIQPWTQIHHEKLTLRVHRHTSHQFPHLTSALVYLALAIYLLHYLIVAHILVSY